MSLQARIESLKERHASLEVHGSPMKTIGPRPDDGTLSRLKLQKLRLKEEMERLRSQLIRACLTAWIPLQGGTERGPGAPVFYGLRPGALPLDPAGGRPPGPP